MASIFIVATPSAPRPGTGRCDRCAEFAGYTSFDSAMDGIERGGGCISEILELDLGTMKLHRYDDAESAYLYWLQGEAAEPAVKHFGSMKSEISALQESCAAAGGKRLMDAILPILEGPAKMRRAR